MNKVITVTIPFIVHEEDADLVEFAESHQFRQLLIDAFGEFSDRRVGRVINKRSAEAYVRKRYAELWKPGTPQFTDKVKEVERRCHLANGMKHGARNDLKVEVADRFTVLHADHGIDDDQMEWILDEVSDLVLEDGFFIKELRVPRDLGEVPMALHGPACGDDPVPEDEVFYSNRGSDREWEDRLVDRPVRSTRTVQVIGIREGAKYTIFTAYGGPLAPQHPDDPTNAEPEAARAFWAEHALSWAPES